MLPMLTWSYIFRHPYTCFNPLSLCFLLSLSPSLSLCLPHTPYACRLTRDKPCPCPPLTPAEEEKEGGLGGPSAPQKPEWLRAAHIHLGNKRSLCQEGRGGGREGQRRDRKTIQALILFIMLCNMQQKNRYPKQGCHDSGGFQAPARSLAAGLEAKTNSLSELSSRHRWKRRTKRQRKNRGGNRRNVWAKFTYDARVQFASACGLDFFDAYSKTTNYYLG